MHCQKHGIHNCSSIRCVELRSQDWYKEIPGEYEVITQTGANSTHSTQTPTVYSPEDLVKMSKDELSKVAIIMGLEWESALNKEELVKLVLGGQSL